MGTFARELLKGMQDVGKLKGLQEREMGIWDWMEGR